MEEKHNVTLKKGDDVHVDNISNWFDINIEKYIFKLKHLAILAVFGGLILATVLFISGLITAGLAITKLILLWDLKLFIIYVLKSADLFLFGMVMIIFSLGTYNLFISKLDNIDGDSKTNKEHLPNWLNFSSFDELKVLLIKVIILILSITFLEMLIQQSDKFIDNELYNLLIVPIGVVLISYSLKLIHSHK
jgi:uncharacterized membrane protein YqhA